MVLKNLANRRAFNLNDKQITQVHKKFKNMCLHRKDSMYATKRSENERALRDQLQPSFRPQVNAAYKPKEQNNALTARQPSHKRERSFGRTEEQSTFKPQLNQHSLDMINQNEKRTTLIDRN